MSAPGNDGHSSVGPREVDGIPPTGVQPAKRGIDLDALTSDTVRLNSMQFILLRLFEAGRPLPPLRRRSLRSEGTMTVRQELDSVRHRNTLVARFRADGELRELPPLYDVVLVSVAADHWVLSGHERIEAGPLQELHMVVQSWHLTPGPMAELERVDNAWAQAARELHELREKIALAGIVLPGEVDQKKKPLLPASASRG